MKLILVLVLMLCGLPCQGIEIHTVEIKLITEYLDKFNNIIGMDDYLYSTSPQIGPITTPIVFQTSIGPIGSETVTSYKDTNIPDTAVFEIQSEYNPLYHGEHVVNTVKGLFRIDVTTNGDHNTLLINLENFNPADKRGIFFADFDRDGAIDWRSDIEKTNIIEFPFEGGNYSVDIGFQYVDDKYSQFSRHDKLTVRSLPSQPTITNIRTGIIDELLHWERFDTFTRFYTDEMDIPVILVVGLEYLEVPLDLGRSELTPEPPNNFLYVNGQFLLIFNWPFVSLGPTYFDIDNEIMQHLGGLKI